MKDGCALHPVCASQKFTVLILFCSLKKKKKKKKAEGSPLCEDSWLPGWSPLGQLTWQAPDKLGLQDSETPFGPRESALVSFM